jgi:hypothetical protein
MTLGEDSERFDTATEGDPKLDIDLHRATVVIADDAPQQYSVTISLDPVH